MDGLQIFILAALALMAVTGAHRRLTRARLVRDLHNDGKSADEIAKIMKAYKED